MNVGPASHSAGQFADFQLDNGRKLLPMRPSFPGMDPWLEHPARWLGVHNHVIAAISNEIVPKVAPRYYVDIKQHTYLILLDGDEFLSRPDLIMGRTKSREPVPGPVGPGTSAGAVCILELVVQVPIKERVEEW